MADIEFPKAVSDDPIEIRQEIIAGYEKAANKRLYPAQTDNFVLNELAYRESRSKSQFNAANKQNYIRYATGVLLDELGGFWDTPRLEDEDDEQYRIRIMLAPEALTTTGTRGGYEYHIRSTDPSITAVGFANPNPGSGWVETFILTKDGLPSDDLRARVFNTVTSEAVHVLGVGYQVSSPEVFEYGLKVKIVVEKAYEKQAIRAQVLEALGGAFDADGNQIRPGYVHTLEKGLGLDLIPSRFSRVAQDIEGVHSVTVLEPAQDIILTEGQWPKNTVVDVQAVGLDED